MKFYSPYQFIPVTKVSKQTTPFTDIAEGEKSHIRHDRWQQGTLSGRIICRLETVSPVMIGAKQNADPKGEQSTSVENYRFPQDSTSGRLGIPGNSLRGMTASVAEAISCSSMRVMTDASYSVRKEMGEALQAIGEIQKAPNGDFHILPLALVTSKLDEKQNIKFHPRWKHIFGKSPLNESLAGYVGNYWQEHQKIADRTLGKHSCFQAIASREFFYAKTDPALKYVNMQSQIKISEANGLHATNKGKAMLAGQKVHSHPLLTEATWQALIDVEQQSYTRGVLYILGKKDVSNKDRDMPNNKKHELFIPYPENGIKTRATIPIPAEVVQNFNTIAQARHESNDQLPFLPQGYQAEPDSFIKNGDLVYFLVDDKGTQVTEISFSAIWRSNVKKSTHAFFTPATDGDQNVLPWGSRDRTDLTPAEALFGVVESNKKANKASSENLASRLRFYDAFSLHSEVTQLGKQTLKILASPKTPSPTMYFRSKQNGYVRKQNLNNGQAIPNGRKRYLHHRQTDIDAMLWQTTTPDESANQKVECDPLAAKQDFYFHIDFNNLSPPELGLLCVALEPERGSKRHGDNNDFMHKIGLGKSLGLGSVKLTIEGLFHLNRAVRYTPDGLSSNRYHQVFIPSGKVLPAELADRYPLEMTVLEKKAQPDESLQIEIDLVDQDSLDILIGLGRQPDGDIPVCYPVSGPDGQRPHHEGAGFNWFVKNIDRKQPLGTAPQWLKKAGVEGIGPALALIAGKFDASRQPLIQAVKMPSTIRSVSKKPPTLQNLRINGFAHPFSKKIHHEIKQQLSGYFKQEDGDNVDFDIKKKYIIVRNLYQKNAERYIEQFSSHPVVVLGEQRKVTKTT